MLYELATLSCPLLTLSEAADRAKRWIDMPEARGDLLGCWRTDLGALGRLFILRGFAAPEDMTAERHRALLAANPFNAGACIATMDLGSYTTFSFLPPARPAARGSVYEFRTYRLKPGGLKPTLAGWEAAIEPARPYTDHLVTNMYALDGAPRITHIWAFESLEQRRDLRTQAYGAGVWPPRGGPEQVLEATATIGLPEPWSPLR